MKFSTVLRALHRSKKGRLATLGLQLLWPAVSALSGQAMPMQGLSGSMGRTCDPSSSQDPSSCQPAMSMLGSQEQDPAESADGGMTLKSLGSRLPKDYNSQLLGPAVGKPLTSRRQPESPEASTVRRERVSQPLSEFQRFVSSSVGAVLAVFGQELFEESPSTFAPLDSVPVSSNYVIGPGDEIQLRVWGASKP